MTGRYYLHGDPCGADYYCVRCDDFVGRAHFDRCAPPDVHYQRYQRQIKARTRLPGSILDPGNLFG